MSYKCKECGDSFDSLRSLHAHIKKHGKYLGDYYVENYARKDKLISIIIKNVPSNQRLVLASKLTNPLGWYLPIEDNELERNKNLVQNPYYAGY